MLTFSRKEKRVWLVTGVVVLLVLGISQGVFSQGTHEKSGLSLQEAVTRASE